MKIRFCLLFLLPLFASAQKKLTINGKIKGLKDGSSVALINANLPSDTLGKAVVKKESFEMKADLKEPTLLNLNLAPGKTLLTFLENSTIKITGDVNQLKQLNVKGSRTHDDFKAFQQTFDPLFEKLVKTNQQMQSGGRTDSLAGAMDKVRSSIEKEIDNYIAQRPSSPVSAFVLAATMPINDDILITERRFNLLTQTAAENTYGNYVKAMIDETKITAIGAVAADFTQADTSGNLVSLSSFRGKYVLVDFWASWCGPCRQENPNVVANYQKFSSRNFTVLGVSLDRPGQKDRWLQAIHTDNLTWTHVSDLQYWNNAVAQQYRVQTIPQNFLIGPDGKIVAKNLRGAALEAKLCEVLGCN